jgi:hypothetical protein
MAGNNVNCSLDDIDLASLKVCIEILFSVGNVSY